jgi:hypothetical protein
MGEWCLLSQLQGLVGLFLMASPAVVEWCYSAFAAVEAAAVAKRLQRPTASVLAAGAGTAGGIAPLGIELLLGVDELDVLELELLLQVNVVHLVHLGHAGCVCR